MNRTEWNQAPDSLRNDDTFESDGEELALNRPLPVLDQLARQLDLPDKFQDAEAVINKVVEVAENNRTIERVLERKHEVKDLAVARNEYTQYASKLSEVLETKKDVIPTITTDQLIKQQAQSTAGLKRFMNDTTLYGYAIRYGFISGLLALLVATMFVVLFT